jgi:hypothetical protein
MEAVCWYPPKRLHCVVSQKTIIWLFTAVNTSDLFIGYKNFEGLGSWDTPESQKEQESYIFVIFSSCNQTFIHESLRSIGLCNNALSTTKMIKYRMVGLLWMISWRNVEGSSYSLFTVLSSHATGGAVGNHKISLGTAKSQDQDSNRGSVGVTDMYPRVWPCKMRNGGNSVPPELC